MGSRGPIPLSVEVLAAHGSTLTKRRRAKVRESNSVKPVAPIACPSWLSAEAKAEWRRVVAALRPFGILRPADATALGRYCEMQTLWQRLVEARDAAQDTNDPACIRLERRALKVCAALVPLADRFGLTPASRARLGLPLQAESKPESSRLRFFPQTREAN